MYHLICGMRSQFNNAFGSHVEMDIMESEGRLSQNDPHSYANTEEVTTTHIHIELETKFFENFFKLEGFVILHLLKRKKNAQTVRIDARELKIESIMDEDSRGLDWKIVKNMIYDMPSQLGDLVEITLPESQKNEYKIYIYYETEDCHLWLSSGCAGGGLYYYDSFPDEEEGRTLFFTQGQATNTRTWIPCQDTPTAKVTYTATITGPENFQVLMSAVANKTFYTEDGEEKKRFQHLNRQSQYQHILLSWHQGRL